ncbi:uncharacterized protein LOC120777899 isoform X4 [Bactrocera tryoni]|uniref:uncharacterized protein LOC120777899 isoform X4 n=1 Tax=Bactrocera tryoni TaxID=59916 RepID=UPI001A9904B6|nr:uncharacterized protein LOC120777899 isoform X4 [Bactrocera tryoni]
MGKCVSKHPSVLTIALSEKDLAAANHIWSKFAESTEYIALKDEHGNQLCEYYYVSGKKRKTKPKTTKQQLAPTKGNNDANTTTVGATRSDQDSNENQNQRQQQSQKKGRNKRRSKTTQKQSSTQQSSENKSQQWTTNSEQTTNTNGTESYTERLQQDCVTSQAELSAHAADGLTTTTATTSTIVYSSVSGCEYCTVVSTTDDDDESEGGDEDEHWRGHDDSDDSEQLFGIHNHNNATEAIVVDNTNKETAVGTHKNQQHCVAHLPSQPQEQIAGDTVAPDANNNAEIAAKHEEYAYQPKWQQQRLDATEKGQLINSEVSKVNIGVIGVENAAELDNVDGNSERLSGSEHLTVEGSDYMQGQAESKRHSKKHGSTTNATTGTGVGAIETKGTAMSFGFRKKLNTTPKKFKKLLEAGVGGMTGGGDGKRKQDKCNNITTTTRDGNTPSEDNAKRATVIDGETLTDEQQQDDNGNAVKRRSKSAHAGRALTSGDETSESGSCSDAAGRPKITQPKSITFNLSQNSTIEYQRRQFFEQPNTYGSYGSGRSSAANIWTHQPGHQAQQHQSRNVISTGMHTNVIVRPTPRAPPASFSKFTLHTVSLPKPEFPVAISVGATTPTTPSSIYTPSPTMATSVAGARTKENQQQQHPLTVVACATVTHSASGHMDLKTAKQMANNTRRGFSGSREISADSGIASMDMALDSSVSSGGGSRAGRTASPKRSRSRPRNLQMVMNGRHKFEVRDLDDPLSSESSSIVEPLALPKLPNENQTVPLPLCGLVRSNTVLSRETYERNGGVIGNRSASANPEIKQVDIGIRPTTAPAQCTITRNSSEESEGVDEEKLYLDRSTSEKGNRFKDINTCSSKTSSPGSSIMLSWCNAGESLAVKDCSSLSISSEDSNKLQGFNHQDKDTDTEKNDLQKFKHMSVDLNDDDLSGIVTEMQVSTLSSLTDNLANENNNSALKTIETNITTIASTENANIDKPDRPKSFYNTLNETKFAEMALAGSTYLLDDETSPTDSLVSSTESEEAASKQKKHKINEELQEKDIDEISPELEMGSPISPGTPTHASHSLSLSDCGNLIDDEIADQPALLFNSEAHDLVDSLTSHKDKTETPTLMENTGSMRSLKSQSKARTALQQAIELSLRTPLSLRKAVMERAESLDTLSPCESICSDDLMMDFDIHSSVDSIDRSGSIKSRSGSDLHKIDDTELFSELERKGSDVMKELNSLLRLRSNKSADKDVDIAHLPARATRLLNRSRLQQQQYPSSIASGVTTNAATSSSVCGGGGDSDSSKSAHSLRRSAAASRASNASTSSTNASLPPSTHYQHQKPFQHHYSQLHRDSHSSSDDLMLYDKSFRNAMIQDVLQFKKQLLRLRRILQDTETLNPFDNDNGQLFAACGLDSKLLDDMDLASLTSSTTDDPMLELADLRRQVVYLQGEVEDRERTIRLQKNQIENLESKKPPIQKDHTKELMNIATQTERTRPLSYGLDGLSRSKPEYTSYTTRYHPVATCENNSNCNGANNSNNSNNNLCTYQQQHNCCNGSNNNLPATATEAAAQQIRRHTIISTTLSNYNQQSALAPRRASIAWEKPTAPAPPTTPPLAQTATAAGTKHAPPAATTYKPVKITLIGEPLKQWQWNAVGNGKTSDSHGHTAADNHSDKEGKAKREASDGNNKSGRNSSRCGGNGGSGGVCNGKSNGANCANGSNGYTNGTSSQTNGRNEVSGNGLQKETSQQTNHHYQMQIKPYMQQALTQPGQQQQTRVQQQQQQQQVYHTTNGSNGNFNPTVTIV